MARVKIGNGFTRIANELLEQIYKRPFQATQLRATLWILRDSYGWNRKKTEPIGSKRLSREIYMPVSSVRLALQILLEAKVIGHDEKGRWWINKDYETWLMGGQPIDPPGQPIDPGVSPLTPTKGVSPLTPRGQPTDPPSNARANDLRMPYIKTQQQRHRGKGGQPIDPSKRRTQNTHSKFQPPTIDEVRAYCKERSNKVDPEIWRDHYASVGWKVGRLLKPMRDWKAAVRTWEKSDGASRQVGHAAPRKGKYDELG